MLADINHPADLTELSSEQVMASGTETGPIYPALREGEYARAKVMLLHGAFAKDSSSAGQNIKRTSTPPSRVDLRVLGDARQRPERVTNLSLYVMRLQKRASKPSVTGGLESRLENFQTVKGVALSLALCFSRMNPLPISRVASEWH